MNQAEIDKLERKLKFEDRFHPAKRNLIWISVLSVALATAVPATVENVADNAAKGLVKIPGLELSFPVHLAGVFLLVAVVYCFIEYRLEYKTAFLENTEALSKHGPSLTDLFQLQARELMKSMGFIRAAGQSAAAIQHEISKAVEQYAKNFILPPDKDWKQRETAILNAEYSLAKAMQSDFDAETTSKLRSLVHQHITGSLLDQARMSANSKRLLMPTQPFTVPVAMQGPEFQEQTAMMAQSFQGFLEQQSSLAKDFQVLSTKLHGPQKDRFFWIDKVTPLTAFGAAIIANFSTIVGFNIFQCGIC